MNKPTRAAGVLLHPTSLPGPHGIGELGPEAFRFGEAPWVRWDGGLAQRDAGALARARRELAGEVRYHEYVQHHFFAHYGAVKAAAGAAGVEVVGDLPIFVAHDSADVWANQDLFRLDEHGEPEAVAGVPPDYFSETGQLWGNPLYRWDRMEETGYAWWTSRLRQALSLYDSVRIDHFRGFEAFWEIPASAETAKKGRWVEGPGESSSRPSGALWATSRSSPKTSATSRRKSRPCAPA